jgi:glycosyltransferase involved in cell wall biosynthesis
LKILQLTYESFGSPFGFGGAGVRAYEIYKRIKDRHDITLLCLKYPEAQDGYCEGLKHIFVGTESTSRTKSVFLYTIKASDYVRRYGRNFDVIIENFLPAIPYFSRFLTKTPVILQIQGIMGSHSLRKFNLLYGLPMYIVEKVYPLLYDTFIYVTDKTRRSLAGDPSIKENHEGNTGDIQINDREISTVIPNGVSSELLNMPREEEDDYLLFLSRVDAYTKGLDVLIDAFEHISQQFQGLQLLLAGYEFDSTEKLFRKLPAETRKRARYLGFVSGEEKRKLISRAKVFVLPSRHEAHPVSALEAMACGKPVLVSDIPELRYIGDNGLGLTFRSGSSQDLAEKLSRLLENSELRQRLGNKGREYASRFLWDKSASLFERFILEVVKNRKAQDRRVP